MKKSFILLSFLLTLMYVKVIAQTINFVPDQLLVKIKNEVAVAPQGISKNISIDKELTSIKSSLQAFSIKSIDRPYINAQNYPALQNVYLIKLNKAEQLEAMIESLQKDPSVEYVEKNIINKAIEHITNDYGSYPEDYHLKRVSANNAWEVSKGSTSVKVAVIDGGFDTSHPDLAGSLNLSAAYDFVDNDNNVMTGTANDNHGTHVAGIVGAITNNGMGVASLAYNVTIIPIRGISTTATSANSIIHAANSGAHIINMSYGQISYPGVFNNTENNAVQYAVSRGCVLVASAGNDNTNQITYPVGYANVVGVASTTSTDQKSSFSNYGSYVDISAPGGNIYSTYPSNQYRYMSGTSMASPLVASLFALVKAANPTFTSANLINRVLDTADMINYRNLSYIGQLGFGRINAIAALYGASYCSNNLGAYNASSLLGLGNITLNGIVQPGTNIPSRDGKYSLFTNANPTVLNTGINTFEAVQFRGSYTNIVVGIWIDFNGNGQFEPSDKIYQGSPNSATPTNFNIPCSAAVGQYRLRIRITDNQAEIDPCSFYEMCDTKDYDVVIQATNPIAMSASSSITTPICAGTSVTLSFSGCVGGTMAWQDNASNVSPRVVTPTQTTIYKAECTKGGCVVDTKVIPVIVPPQGTKNSILIWEKSFGGSAGDSFDDIVKTSDGGYLAIDISYSDISGNKTQALRGQADGLIVKFDVNGNIVWEKAYGGSGHDDLLRIKALSDGNFMVLARSATGIEYEKTSPNNGNIDFWLFKIDPNGNMIWDRTFGANSIDYANDFVATPDGGFILVGTVFMDATMIAPNGDRSQAGKGDHDAWVIKIDANGNKVWDKVFGGSGTESANKIVKATDNSGYYIFGLTSTTNIAGSDLSAPARNGYDAWLLKFDENGNKIFDKVYSGGNTFSGTSSIEDIATMGVLPDGNYLLAAHSNNNSGNEKTENSMGGGDLWLIKISPNGSIIKDKTIGGDDSDVANSFYVRTDGSILFCGATRSNQNVDKKDALKGNYDGWILNLDANLNTIWSAKVGGAIITPSISQEGFSRMIYEGNDIFTFVGSSTESKGDRAESFGSVDAWIIKMNIPLATKPTISSPNTLACVGEPITLNASGCISDILWSNGLTAASIVVKPNSNDNVFTVNCRTDANNCISMQSDVYKPIIADVNQTLTGTASTGTIQVKSTIVSRQTIPSGSNVNYRAGKSITLENNQSFNAQNGSVFKAEIAPCAVENGLLARYDFNNNVQDLSGNNRNGLVNTAFFTKDRFGNPNAALSFNGVNQYVTLGNWFNYQEFTVSFWLNAGATQANAYAELIDNNHTGSRSWFAQQNGTINNQYYFGADGSPRGDVYFNLTSTWNHVTLIKGAGIIKMYLNGRLVGTATHGGSILYDGSQILTLGAWGGVDRFWNGKMDDLKLYNRALSDTEINTIFNAEAPNPSLSAGLFANYKFDGDANDISGKGNNGTINGGATFTTDRFGTANKALNFDGVDDHVSVPNNNTLSGFNEITMSAWVNHNQTSGTLGAIIAKWYQSVQDNYLMVVDGGTNKFGASTNNERIVPFYSPNSIPINTWNHLVFTHNASGDRLFFNGYLVASNTVFGTIIHSTQNLLIGADSNLGTLWRFFKGKIDDVRLYNRALSRLEVQQLYDLEKP